MKKGIFSLMMGLLLAFTGLARANELTVNDGTATNQYIPIYGYYADMSTSYTETQFILPSADLAAMNGGTITGLTFYANYNQNFGNANFDIFMQETTSTTMSSLASYSGLTPVYSGHLAIVSNQLVITFSNAYTYNGGNLLVTFHKTASGTCSSSSADKFYGVSASNGVSGYWYYSSFTTQSFLPKVTFTYSGGQGGQTCPLTVTPETLDMGYRPNECWMRPFTVNVLNEGAACNINGVDVNNAYFVPAFDELDFPFALGNGEDFNVNFGWATGEGEMNGQLVIDYTGNRTIGLFDIMATAYEPVEPDVFEMARVVNSFPYSETLSVADVPLYDNYLLPPMGVEDGPDAVWKLTFTEDQLLNASVDGENGKIAVYTEDFYESVYGFAGPDINNNYTGPQIGGGVAPATPYEFVLGDGTSTDAHYPLYYYFNNSLSQQLYRADELEAAGMSTAPLGSISFYSSSTYTYNFSGTKIWMANVSDTEAPGTSALTAGMTLVYDGAQTEVTGWNEFVLNGDFAWDGSSNILVTFQSNRGTYSFSYPYWQCTAMDFTAVAYDYDDNNAFDAETTQYSMYTATNRANTKFKSANFGRGDVRDVTASIENMTMLPGTYYLVASATSDEFTVEINAETMPCPEEMTAEANLVAPLDDEDGLEPAAVELKWHLSNYTTEYRLRFGSDYYCTEILVDWTSDLAESYTVTDLYNNTNYFWMVEERNAGCPQGIASPVWGFTTHLNTPQNLQAEDYTIFEGETLHLFWTAAIDRTIRQYNIYMNGELIGSTPMNSGETTFDVEGLTYAPEYVFWVTAVYDEGESGPSNMVYVRVSGEGEVDGYVYEQDGVTGIAGATVTVVGEDEFGDPHAYIFTTGADGHYHGIVLAGEYEGYASCEGYQEVEYAENPFTVTYAEVTEEVNFIMNEVYAPVSQVWAEYYPDAEDPESPYVEVYWSNSLQAGLIEDFETGDLSKFEWNVPAQYPFEITTTNPYEGAYCMQSTNYNVASSTSSIDVNVEIPYDGLMSFYKRISCESSWDNAYFYIDGTQVATFTGTSDWGIKEVAVTAGVHNFKWAYTKDSSVNSGEDRFFIDYIDFIHPAQPPIPGDTYTFDDGTMQGWTSIDADGDGYNWVSSSTPGNYHNAGVDLTGTGHNASAHYVISGSYANGTGMALNPDNYLVSPQIELGGIVQFYACAQDASYAAEHFGVAVSTTGNTNAADFTTVQEWTLTAKSTGRACADNRSGRAQGEWYEYTVDLSAYSGMGYVAIRHFNCSDQFILNVDDITIGEPGRSLSNDRSFQFYRVYRTNCYNDGPYIIPDNTIQLVSEVVDTAYIDVSWPDAAPGVYKWGVSCVYAGNRESEINWAEPVNVPAQGEAATATRSELTIFEGTEESYYLPVFTLYGDELGAASQFVIPASELSAMNGSTITSMKFYSNGFGGGTALDATWKGFVKEVNYTEMTQFEDPASGTEIYNGIVTVNNDEMVIDFATPYHYNGGNLLIGFENIAANHYLTVYFLGQTGHPNTGMYRYRTSATPSVVTAGFLPKTTFTYSGGGSQDGLHESEIVWSNCLDKDMFVNPVDVTVLLNSADSPEGTVVTLTNLNEAEREMYPVAPVTLDESGYYVWDTFRRGDYAVSVELDGYEPINDTVSIWDETHLRYVMTEILYGVGNIYVSRTGWAMWDGEIPGPDPHGEGSTFSYNFDGNNLEDWTLIDANNDGNNWMHSSAYTFEDMSNEGHNGSYGFAVSESYINGGYGAVTPDNYLVSPQVNFANGSTFSFWVTDGNDVYGAEHFGVAVSTSGNTSAADFTTISEWTLLSKGEKTGERQLIDGIWYQYTVDLSAYAGQTGYIAIRHFNCYDQWVICVDDCVLTAGAKSGERHLEYYKVLCTSIDGVPIYNHNTVVPMCQLDTNDPYQAPLVEGDHYLCKVAVMYSTGMSAWSEPVEWVYEPCDHWGPVDFVNGSTVAEGNHIVWEFEHGFNPYDPHDTIPPTPGDTEFTEDFENGLNGWNVLDVVQGEGTWIHSDDNLGGYDYTAYAHSGTGFAMGYSFVDYVGSFNIDSYLYTPQKYTITNGSTLTFWADNANDSYPENFSVCVATADNPSAADFTQVWAGGAKAGNAAKSDNRHNGNRSGNWRQHTIDLSAYAGQNVYIAFHDVNYDMYEIWIDDVQLTAGAKGANAFASGMAGNAYAFNITDVANFDERVYVLYNLNNDVRFDVINGEADGMFMVSAAAGYEDMDLEETINDFMFQADNQFRMMDKVQAADVAREYKAALPSSFANSLMTDIYVASRENNMCATAEPFCTDEPAYQFPAGVDAGSGENGPYYDCLYTTPNPAWYFMKMGADGGMDIYMYSTPGEDIDFCCWGPFEDPTTPCPYGLTADKVVSCSYSAQPTEHCMIPETAQTGEYYILVITNYSNDPCNITFEKVDGEGQSDCTIIDVDIIGFLITMDGEYLDIVGPTVREYTHEGEYGDHVYCVRPIYPGEMTLPDHNYGWSMGCPICSDGPVPPVECEAGAPIRGEYVWNNAEDFGALISWGEQVEPIDEWLYYDNGIMETSIGTGSTSGAIYWGIMIPATQLSAYAGCSLTQVAVMEYNTGGTYTLNISYGGNNAPGTLVHTQDFTTTGTLDWKYVTLNSALPIDPSQNLWITLYQSGIDFPATCCTNTGDINGRWASVDGVQWADVNTLGDGIDATWMLRGYVTNLAKGGEIHALAPFKGETSNATLSASAHVSIPTHFAFANRADIVKYNVYRSTDNVEYEFIGSVDAAAGQEYYEYFDATAAGTYYYQVRAEYSNGCESEPAVSEANPANNYVIVNVTSVAENGEVALYPNPTNGNITIQAQNMNRITVVSVLGQVVYDAEIEGDSYIMNMAQFNAGVYMVRIATENGVSTQRVTVVK